MSHNIQLIRDAKVESYQINNGDYLALKIVVNNQFEHTFKKGSRENSLLFSTDRATINQMLSGGTFMFIDNKLVDYRPADYKGFIHSEEGIEQLIDILGATPVKKQSRGAKGLYGQVRSTKTNGFLLGKKWDKFDLEVAGLDDGGHFNNELVYQWSPFSDTIKSSINVKRLVCLNGMVGIAPFVVMDIPLINCWEEHLDMSTTILKPKYQDILSGRFKEMTKTPASLAATNSAYNLIQSVSSSCNTSSDNIDRVAEAINPLIHTSHVYREKALSSHHSEFLPAHLTQFDLMNALTEVSTHYTSDHAKQMELQSKVNHLVFDSFNDKPSLTLTTPVVTTSNHNKVFFGEE